jgi:hypothetical protein
MRLSKEYMAGFFDGEGCISIFFATYSYPNKKTKGTTQLAVTIANTNLDILEFIAAQYGGAIHKAKPDRSGKRRQAYVWRLARAVDQLRFLTEIKEYIIVKHEAIENALRYLSTVKHSGYRPSQEEKEIRRLCWEQSGHLNKRANGVRVNTMVI